MAHASGSINFTDRPSAGSSIVIADGSTTGVFDRLTFEFVNYNDLPNLGDSRIPIPIEYATATQETGSTLVLRANGNSATDGSNDWQNIFSHGGTKPLCIIFTDHLQNTVTIDLVDTGSFPDPVTTPTSSKTAYGNRARRNAAGKYSLGTDFGHAGEAHYNVGLILQDAIERGDFTGGVGFMDGASQTGTVVGGVSFSNIDSLEYRSAATGSEGHPVSIRVATTGSSWSDLGDDYPYHVSWTAQYYNNNSYTISKLSHSAPVFGQRTSLNGNASGKSAGDDLNTVQIASYLNNVINNLPWGITSRVTGSGLTLSHDTEGADGNVAITGSGTTNTAISGLSGGAASGAGMAANRLTEYGRYIVMERVSGSQSPTVGKEGEKIVPSDAGTVSYANAGFMFYSGSSESTSRFFSVMGSGSVAREVVHQLDTFTGSVVLPGSEKVEFNGAGSGEQIFSSTGGQLDIDADTLIEVTAPTFELAGATKVDIQSDAVHFGENGDTDVVLTFNANSADGELKWMEDEDYFEFSDDVLLASDEKLQFRDTAIYVHSSADGQLDLAADGAVSVDAGGDIVLDADGGEIEFRDGGVLIGALSNSSSDLILSSSQADKDIKFQGNDGGSGITALTLDMSEAGKATFNSSVEVTNAGSFIIGSADMNEADLEKLDGITNGTAEAGKAVVLDADLSIGTIQNLTASFAKIGTLDVDVINSVTKTESTLEVEDKLIISSLSASAANSDGGGLQIGSKEGATDYAAAVLYDHQGGSTPSLTFRIAGSTRTQVRSTGLHPGANNATSLGLSSLSWSDLFLGDGAVVNFNNGDVTMTHSSNLLTVTGGNTRVDRLEIDGASDYIDVDTDLQVIAAADIVLDPAGGEVKVDGNLVPNSDSDDELGASGTAWSALYVDSIDLNGQGDISMGGTGRIDLDADDDTSIRASADDVITLEVGGSDKLHLSATALYAESNDDVALGSLHKGFSDLYLAGGAVINFNNDTTLTHVSGSGLLLSDDSGVGTDKLMFGDSATYIHQAADGQLDAVADSVIQVTAPTVNIEASTAITLESDSVTFGEAGSSNIQLDFNTSGNDGTLTWIAGSDHFLFSDDVSISQNEKLKLGSDNEHLSANGAGQISLVGSSHITLTPGNASSLFIGASGAGKDVYFYGGASNEQIQYDASDHQLKVTDSSGALQLTIGGDDSAEFAIDVSQATSNSGKIRATAFVTYSDETLKTNIKPMNNAMDTVMKLQGVNFDWKNDGASDFGFIAQDLQKVIPQAVSSADTEDGVMGVDYSRLTAVLVEAMKAQQTEIETLKSAIAKLSK